VQPFGGEGQSGTGPKAGGPNYLRRFGADGVPAGLPRGVEAAAPAAPAAPDDAARRELGALHAQQADWADTPLERRVAWLRRAADALPPSQAAVADGWRALAAQAAAMLPAQALPGPTGERNELRLHGRGLFAFVGDGAPPPLARALAAALVAGNTAAWVAEASAHAEAQPWLAPLQAGLPAHTLGLLAGRLDGLGSVLVADARVAGVCATSTEALPRLARQLAAQDGAIVPLLALSEAANPRNLYRFCAEQTLTINTAAAGGNAALLAAGV
jgi:RHH-type proline utilization regulon transcriptional repressor/proline dehydrogenase/delta 1-pyrroline-5-carboxylate dehydrogenase